MTYCGGRARLISRRHLRSASRCGPPISVQIGISAAPISAADSHRRQLRGRTSLNLPFPFAATLVDPAWSVDLLSDAVARGQRIKCLGIADGFTRECFDIYIESVNGNGGDECLTESWFEPLAQARELIAFRRQNYDQVRPYGIIGRHLSAEFADDHRKTT